jgi:hypothetical protein
MAKYKKFAGLKFKCKDNSTIEQWICYLGSFQIEINKLSSGNYRAIFNHDSGYIVQNGYSCEGAVTQLLEIVNDKVTLKQISNSKLWPKALADGLAGRLNNKQREKILKYTLITILCSIGIWGIWTDINNTKLDNNCNCVCHK